MAIRIGGVPLPDRKPISAALTSIYGIGRVASHKILAHLLIKEHTRTKDLSEEEVRTLKEYVEKNFKVEGDLRREVIGNIQRLKQIHAWRGIRHTKHLPARGQRTKTNSRTVRGNVRRTMGSGRKDAPSAK